jgi:uncharacterized protein YceH (UPF0502 family)
MLDAVELSAAELRVLGSLVEKQLTTPQHYPLTLNALTLACSQTSNRHPVVPYDEHTVEAAVTSVKTLGLARFVHPSHGRSALRYAHALGDALGLDTRPLALLAALMLRGPQTLGELRARSERMVGFGDLGEVEAELEALAVRTEPLVARLPRAPGQKEERYRQLLGGPAHAGDADEGVSPPAKSPVSGASPGGGSDAALGAEAEALRDEVAELRAEVSALRRDLDHLRQQLGA